MSALTAGTLVRTTVEVDPIAAGAEGVVVVEAETMLSPARVRFHPSVFDSEEWGFDPLYFEDELEVVA